ncbi:MAG: group III truncated hemoglobin [Bacteroidota bacterium]
MKSKKSDITDEEDVILMVDSFYQKVRVDDLLGPVFNDVAQVDWEVHLPKMYGFWNKLILGQPTYKGNPFAVHVPLPIHAEHFDRWIQLFEQNINEHFTGAIAEHTKLRAQSIAHIFQSKLKYIKPTW